MQALIEWWLELDSIFKVVWSAIPLGGLLIVWLMIRDVKNMFNQNQLAQRSLEATNEAILAEQAKSAKDAKYHALKSSQAQYDVGVMTGQIKERNWFLEMLSREKQERALEQTNIVKFKKK
ncbi:hypothetical protein [Pseudoalteromonas piratica]|uniref:Uncharacterized protein n=1 Tax=Pseudoalteromonas piratica TaxID=1348114 RepID=A0A0A7EEX3_9GAMM|nr:hypothetical protein [Pseudoalteromonas piratica]AIY65225.1 hypothetical protein OM33_08665 [Pseudoalteromonas piratica]